MVKANGRIDYSDFEHIMIHLAGERGWIFKFGDESVPVEAVFNHSTYAPALLAAAETELAARRIGGDLAFGLEGEGNSLFGARVRFVSERNTFLSQFWRIATTALIIESLPRSGNSIMLDQLQYVLGDRFADYVETATAGAS